jgi:hypothetical protein
MTFLFSFLRTRSAELSLRFFDPIPYNIVSRNFRTDSATRVSSFEPRSCSGRTTRNFVFPPKSVSVPASSSRLSSSSSKTILFADSVFSVSIFFFEVSDFSMFSETCRSSSSVGIRVASLQNKTF